MFGYLETVGSEFLEGFVDEARRKNVTRSITRAHSHREEDTYDVLLRCKSNHFQRDPTAPIAIDLLVVDYSSCYCVWQSYKFYNSIGGVSTERRRKTESASPVLLRDTSGTQLGRSAECSITNPRLRAPLVGT